MDTNGSKKTLTTNPAAQQVLAALLALFCWQSYVSVRKFFLGRVASTFAQVHEDRVAWPAVTVCPVNAEPTSRIRLVFGFGFVTCSCEKERLKVQFTAHQTISMTEKLDCRLDSSLRL